MFSMLVLLMTLMPVPPAIAKDRGITNTSSTFAGRDPFIAANKNAAPPCAEADCSGKLYQPTWKSEPCGPETPER